MATTSLQLAFSGIHLHGVAKDLGCKPRPLSLNPKPADLMGSVLQPAGGRCSKLLLGLYRGCILIMEKKLDTTI